MPKRIHSSLILTAVFALGIAAGIGGMVWAWPGLRAKYFPHHRTSTIDYLRKNLGLDPAQIPQVQAVFKETGDRSHQIHLQFRPQYAKICDDYTAVRRQERDAFAPVRQQELDKLHTIMTSAQWQTFQNERTASQRPQRPPDVCRNLYGNGGPPSHGGPPPNGGPASQAGPGRRGTQHAPHF